MPSIVMSDSLSLDNDHNVAGVLFDVGNNSIFSQVSTSPGIMNSTGETIFFHSAGQPSVTYPSNTSPSKVHAPKRHRDCEEQLLELNDVKTILSPALTFNTEQEMQIKSSRILSQIPEKNNQHYLIGESDCSSDEDPLGFAGIGSEVTSGKSKKVKLDNITATAGISDLDANRRNLSPACRYDVVRVALLRFRELFGNTCVKRGFVVPSGSADWPEETWGIRLDLVRIYYIKSILSKRPIFSAL